jgi:hypothetical protein
MIYNTDENGFVKKDTNRLYQMPVGGVLKYKIGVLKCKIEAMNLNFEVLKCKFEIFNLKFWVSDVKIGLQYLCFGV